MVFARYLLWAASRVVLALRYRLRVVGREEAAKHPGPFLVLPNHPAYADPPNVFVGLWPTFKFRPMALETNFQNPVLAPVAWLARAIPVPDTAVAGAETRQRATAAVDTVVAALKAGDNVILWPSGSLSRDGAEKVGGARAVADVLVAVPDATLVLVRTRGLWGSSLSWAYGHKPSMVGKMLRGIPVVLSNLLFFAPRRNVTLTLEAFPPGSRPEPTREAINPWLDAWYAADGGERPTFVPYHFAFGPRTVEYPPPAAAEGVDLAKVPAEAKRGVVEILEDKLKRPLADEEKQPTTAFADLGLDSLDGMEVALETERRFGFSGGEVPATLGQLWALASGQLGSTPPKPPPPAWFAPPSGDRTAAVLGETVPAALVARCVRHPGDVAVADDLSGVLTYRRLFLGALILAERFRQIPGESVGLLLPASVASTLSLFALHLAGKRPVLLNWTTGPANMAHGVKLTGVTHVVTSQKFIDRAQVEVPGAEFVFLEAVRGTVGRAEQVRRLLAVSLFPRTTGRRALAKLDPDPQRPAVVLFTSGSEKAPKAVPLTHANVLGDIRCALPLLEIDRTLSLLVFLPVFHSFGHTITGLLPLVVGLKALYHPDPTDAGALVRKAAAYRTDAVCGTPTFLGFLFDRAKGDDLAALRVIVVGAEKCPPRVFEQVKRLAPEGVVMEGYGVTECSPCVAVNPRSAARPGTIGKPLAGVSVRVVDSETGAELPPGGRGLLHVAGPIVFPGYLGHDGPQPFEEHAGKRWYNTGDLVSLDADSYLTFHGRLKRFLKAGGEMISLPALEEPFAAKYPPDETGPRVAVEGVELDGGRRVVLFTTQELSLKEANAVLTAEGFRGVMRLDEVRRVDKIPVLGTGKTDYKVLRAQLSG